MRVCKLHSLCTETVEVRGINIALVLTERFDIAVSEIVSKDEHDVGSLRIDGFKGVGAKKYK